MDLKKIIELSRFYGSDKRFVIAGGGNTSYKNNDFIWVKASGISLSDINEEGFVKLSRKELKKISLNEYPSTPAEREKEVKEDMMAAVISEGASEMAPRPSVETSLHNIFRHQFVVHTHPTLINALMCSINAENKTEELFGENVVYVEYTDPGYTLFKKTEQMLSAYRKKYSEEPGVILLQNHGLIVGGETPEAVQKITDELFHILNKHIKTELHSTQQEGAKDKNRDLLERLSGKYNRDFLFSSNKLISHFVSSYDVFESVNNPFTPDDIVYCRSKYLFTDSMENLNDDILEFEKSNGFIPYVIAVKGEGLLVSHTSKGEALIALEIFENMMKVAFLAENFGGPKSLSDSEIDFIENWESENYRRQIIK